MSNVHFKFDGNNIVYLKILLNDDFLHFVSFYFKYFDKNLSNDFEVLIFNVVWKAGGRRNEDVP